MKCLSVKQPWASLIVRGIKDVENRTWKTNYRGVLLIHASRQFDKNALIYSGPHSEHVKGVNSQSWSRGAIIGVVKLIDCIPGGHKNIRSKWHQEGFYGFYMDKAFECRMPIKYKGLLYMFNVPDEIMSSQISEFESLTNKRSHNE